MSGNFVWCLRCSHIGPPTAMLYHGSRIKLLELEEYKQTFSGVASYGALGHWGTCPLNFQRFHFSSLWSKSDSQLSKYCVVCEISWCRCQQLAALSISTALVTKAAAPCPEVRRECPIMTCFPALPFLATNPGDATGKHIIYHPRPLKLFIKASNEQEIP